MPNPGEMRHRITVIGIVLVDRPDGGQTPQEVTVIDQAPCQFVPLTIEERLLAGTQYATATARAVLWLDAAVQVTATMQAAVTHPERGNTTEHQLIGPPIERPPDLELLLTERVT